MIPIHLHPRRLFLGLVCLGMSVAAPALRAETFNVPADGSGISLDLPAGWTGERQGDTVVCASPGEVFRIEFSPWRETGNPPYLLRQRAHQIADAEKISVTEEKEEGADANERGVKVRSYRLDGTGPRGEKRTVGTALLTPPGGTACFMRAVLKTADKEKYMADMVSLFQSFRSAGGPGTATPPAGNFHVVPVPPAGAGGPTKFPADGSGITFTVPPGWSATAEGDNLRVATNDGTLAVVFTPADAITDPASQLPAMARTLAEGNGITDTKSEEHDQKSRGDASVSIHSSALDGKRDGHEVIAGVALISPERGQKCLLELVIDTVAAKAHQQELERFLDTIKSAR